MKTYGQHFREYIKELLNIRKTEEIFNLSLKSQFTVLLDNFNELYENMPNQLWLKYYFEKQQINPAKFLAWLQIIKTERYKKNKRFNYKRSD